MSQPPREPFAGQDAETRRRKIIAGRNTALALVLVGFVVLFFAITIVKMKANSARLHPASAASSSTSPAPKA